VTDKTPEQPRYPKPKILLMDIDSSVGAYLRKKGFNIADGSFGRKYEISQLRISGIRDNSRIPKNYAESDIVIVDLLQNHNIPEPEECDFIIDAEGRPEILIDTLSTVIDPRPIIMKRTQSNFDKILGHKGVFVIFSANKSTITGADFGATLPVAKLQRDFDLNTWSFLSVLSGTNPSWIQSQVGVEMELTDKPNILENLLRKYILESEYYCKFVNSDSHISGWLPLIKNKFNEDVAGVILSDSESSRLGKPKQLLKWQGDTLLNNTIRIALESNLNPVIVVLGAFYREIKESLLITDRVRVVRNLAWKKGQSTSLIAGINALENYETSLVYMLCDQPLITSEFISKIVAKGKFTGADVVMLRTNGKRTPPLLFSNRCFDRILSLKGDKGARDIVDEFSIEYLENNEAMLNADIDTDQDYQKFLNKNSHSQ